MSVSKTLPSLFILIFLLNSLHAHECVHGHDDFPHQPMKEHHPKDFIHFAAQDYQNIRMAFDFTNIQSGSPALQEYIKESLIPPVKNYLHGALKVIPMTSNIKIEPDFCGRNLTIPASASKEGYAADTVILVSVIDDPSAAFLARSWNCAFDPTTGRPTIGVIQYNVIKIPLDNKDITLEVELSTTLHEITHALGFSRKFYQKFINPDTLKPLTGHLFNKTVNGVETLVLDVPPLTQRLRAHFNCPTLEGAYLENQGGSGSFGAHFERRVFFNEFMTASRLKDRRISEFTLALLEGSGWYKPNYLYAEPMTYGKNAGCAFLDTECINRETLEPNFKEFCSPLQAGGIYWTKRGMGYCGTSKEELELDESLPIAFDYWGNKTIIEDKFSDNCPHIRMANDSDCEDISGASLALLDTYEFFGTGSKAFMGTLSRDADALETPTGFCLKTQCLKKEDGKYELQVFFSGGGEEGNYVNCSAEGNISATNFAFNHDLVGELRCPDPTEFCEQVLSEGFCKSHCFNNGFCMDNECKCDEGWTSYNCAKKEMVDQCEMCGYSDGLRTTCYGDDCVCNPSNTTCQCLLGLKKGNECVGIDINNGGNSDNGNNSDPQTNPYRESQVIFLAACAILVVIMVAVVLLMRNKQATKLSDSLSQPMMVSQGPAVL